MLNDDDRNLLLAIQDGLPLEAAPYKAVADRLGMPEQQVIERLRSLQDRGVIRRVAAVPDHLKLGFVANGMAVWDVPDERVDEAGRILGEMPEVSHCYRRPRRPGWRYNLYAMAHGRTRNEVLLAVGRMALAADIANEPSEVLFSVRQFRKRGPRLHQTAIPDVD